MKYKIIPFIFIIVCLLFMSACQFDVPKKLKDEPEVLTTDIVTVTPTEETTEKDINKETSTLPDNTSESTTFLSENIGHRVILVQEERDDDTVRISKRSALSATDAEVVVNILNRGVKYKWDGGYPLGNTYFEIDGVKYYYNDNNKPKYEDGFFCPSTGEMFEISLENQRTIHNEIIVEYLSSEPGSGQYNADATTSTTINPETPIDCEEYLLPLG